MYTALNSHFVLAFFSKTRSTPVKKIIENCFSIKLKTTCKMYALLRGKISHKFSTVFGHLTNAGDSNQHSA